MPLVGPRSSVSAPGSAHGLAFVYLLMSPVCRTRAPRRYCGGLGRYSFRGSGPSGGALRALRDPAETDEEDDES